MLTLTEDIWELLGLQPLRSVLKVTLDHEAQEIRIQVICRTADGMACPKCGTACSGYDHRSRQWRLLYMCRFRTIVLADVPRMRCPKHGVQTLQVPWSEPKSRFTKEYESLVIKWLEEASVSAVSRLVGVSWSAIDRIMQRAVKRRLARRADLEVAHVGVDETSFRKRHDYVMIVSDSTTGTVLHVGEDRKKTSLFGWYDHLTNVQLVQIKLASTDMLPAYISATLAHVPNADRKVAFDRFRLANCLGAAVDKVVRQGHKALMKDGRDEFKGTRFDWLTNPASRSHKQNLLFKQLRDNSLKTASAYAIKELVRKLWHDVQPTWALKDRKRWLSGAMRYRLEPV